MLKDLNNDELKLAELMSNISEDGYSAGWMPGLEIALWKALNDGDRNYGRHRISQSEVEKLKFLSEKCNCWILFDDTNEETSIEIRKWKRKFDEGKRKRAYQLIDDILWNDWDPIGVNDMPEGRDEYRSYISRLVDLKISGADYEEIAQHLFQIETSYMGLNGNIENCRRVSQTIVNLAI